MTAYRFFPRMDPPVCIETRARAKPFGTDVTNVGFLPRMSPHVSFEKGRTIEGLATYFAGQKGSLSSPSPEDGTEDRCCCSSAWPVMGVMTKEAKVVGVLVGGETLRCPMIRIRIRWTMV